MLIEGSVVHVDLSEHQPFAKEVNKVGVSLNQIAKTVNATGVICGDDRNHYIPK